jgi:hypothetical protein
MSALHERLEHRPKNYWVVVPKPRATEEHLRALLADHGISEEVGRGRPYVVYQAGEWWTILDVDPDYQVLSPREARTLKGKIDQRPGVVMLRHGIRRGPDTPLLAQIRPWKYKELGVPIDFEDQGVYTGKVSHTHDDPYYHKHTKHGYRYVSSRASSREFEVKPTKEHGDLEDLAEHIRTHHDGQEVPLYEPHPHPMDWWPHLTAGHPGLGIVRAHSRHEHEEFAKYLYAEGEGRAKGMDVHPMAWPLIEKGGHVCYVAMEGCMKADAILTKGKPVIGVGSVTLEEDPEWGRIAREHLSKFCIVVVVPDSDWIANRMVRVRAFGLADLLNEHGVRAIVAAPPQVCPNDPGVCTHKNRSSGLPPEEHKQGVDDFLAMGHQLEEMLTPMNTGHVETNRIERRTVRQQRLAMNQDRLWRVLETYADETGVLDPASAEWLAERTGGALTKKMVNDYLEAFQSRGEVVLEQSETDSRARRIRVEKFQRSYVQFGDFKVPHSAMCPSW